VAGIWQVPSGLSAMALGATRGSVGQRGADGVPMVFEFSTDGTPALSPATTGMPPLRAPLLPG
jgi:hypothetical protein